MELYSYQSPEVVALIHTQGRYLPAWNRCNCFEEDQWQFECSYRFMVDQYNRIKKTNFDTPPVFWYTELRQAKRNMKYVKRGVMLIAQVPDEAILQYDSEDWYGALNLYGIGFGHNYGDVPNWERFDKIWDAYKKNPRAMEESWKEIFHLPLCKRERVEVHAVTMEIQLEWIFQQDIFQQDIVPL